MTYPAGVQLSTLTFSNPSTFLGNQATRTEVTVQASAGVVWAATGEPIDDFSETVSPNAGLPGFLTVPFVDQPGFTDQSGNAFTMWAYTVTRRTFFGASMKVVQKNWQPVLGQSTVDFDNLPGGSIGLPVSAPIVPVTSVAGETGVVGADALADALVGYLPIPDVSGKLDTSEKGVASGVATLDTGSKVPAAQIPDLYVAAAAANAPASQPVSLEQFPFAATGFVSANASNIGQDAITTAPNGSTYAVYWDANLEPRIAVKRPEVGTWDTFSLAAAKGSMLSPIVEIDSHRNMIVAVDGDGYIHVSGNHHVDNLQYVRSANPYDLSSWVSPGMTGANEDKVTYPQFVRLASGDLLFFWRNGDGSGDGNHYVNRYNKATKTWTRVAQIFQGTTPTVDPNQCAYLNRIVYANGKLHIFYMWRDTPDPLTNHDFGYIVSADDGVTWKTAAGATQTLPIPPSNTAPFILTGYLTGLTNQQGASVDSSGNPHSILRLGSTGAWTFNHIYWTGSAWVNEVVFNSVDSLGRPGLYSTTTGKTYALYSKGDNAYALRIHPTIGAPVQLYGFRQKGWEATFDQFAPANKLRAIVSPGNSTDTSTEAGYIGVLTVDMTQVDALPANRYVAPPVSVPRQTSVLSMRKQMLEISGRYEPAAALASTMDRRMIANGVISALTSGQLRLNAIWLAKGTVVTSLSFLAGASATTLTNRWFALYDGTGKKLRVTADDTTNWVGGNVLTLNLSTPYTVPADGIYYAGVCETAATCTQLRGVTGNSNAMGLPPVLAANSGSTGLTTASTAPNTTALTAVSWLAYAYVS